MEICINQPGKCAFSSRKRKYTENIAATSLNIEKKKKIKLEEKRRRIGILSYKYTQKIKYNKISTLKGDEVTACATLLYASTTTW